LSSPGEEAKRGEGKSIPNDGLQVLARLLDQTGFVANEENDNYSPSEGEGSLDLANVTVIPEEYELDLYDVEIRLVSPTAEYLERPGFPILETPHFAIQSSKLCGQLEQEVLGYRTSLLVSGARFLVSKQLGSSERQVTRVCDGITITAEYELSMTSDEFGKYGEHFHGDRIDVEVSQVSVKGPLVWLYIFYDMIVNLLVYRDPRQKEGSDLDGY